MPMSGDVYCNAFTYSSVTDQWSDNELSLWDENWNWILHFLSFDFIQWYRADCLIVIRRNFVNVDDDAGIFINNAEWRSLCLYIQICSASVWFLTCRLYPYPSTTVSWINHLLPVCWSTFWKSTFKQQLDCRFDIMHSQTARYAWPERREDYK